MTSSWLLAGDRVFDSRLLQLLDEQDARSALVDSAPPANLQPLLEGPSRKQRRGLLCGAALLAAATAQRSLLPGNAAPKKSTREQIEHDRSRFPRLEPGFASPHAASLLVSGPGSRPAEKRGASSCSTSAQKGALDFPALVHAPIENFLISHLCRTGDHAEPIDRFHQRRRRGARPSFSRPAGSAGACSLRLIVGVLDGLDGKQARVKVETSKAGKLEHWFDAFFENSWWIALACYLQSSGLLPDAFLYLALLDRCGNRRRPGEMERAALLRTDD